MTNYTYGSQEWVEERIKSGLKRGELTKVQGNVVWSRTSPRPVIKASARG
jgi:hypothetical protein